MRKVIKSAALAAVLACSSSATYAVVPVGNVLAGILAGNGCIVGNGEYGDTTFSFSSPDIVSHGLQADGATVTHTATVQLVGGYTLPAECDAVEIMVTVTEGAFNSSTMNVADDSNWSTTAPTGAIQFKNATAFDVTWTGTVSSTNNDLAEAFDYSKNFTVSVAAVQPVPVP